MGEPYEKEHKRSVKKENVQVTVTGSGDSEFYNTTEPELVDNLVGSTNPRWREQVRNHRNATTVMSAQRERLDTSTFSVTQTFNYDATPPTSWWRSIGKYGNVSSLPSAPTSLPSTLLEQANNVALAAYVSNIRATRTSIQGGVMAGEFGQTLRMLKGRGRGLFSGLRGLKDAVMRRGHRSPIRRLPPRQRRIARQQIVSDLWLEYSFGWRPLLNDISDIIDYINNGELFKEKLIVKNVTGVGFASERRSLTSNPVNRTGSLYPDLLAREKKMSHVIVKYKGQVGAESTAAGYYASQVGLNLEDFAPTLWELIPYSFLADYFTNIGEIVSAGSMSTSGLLWTAKTVKAVHTAELLDWTPEWYEPSSGTAQGISWTSTKALTKLPAAKHTFETVDRTPYTGSLVPDLMFSTPGTGTKWLNLVALFNGFRSAERSFH